NIYVYPSALICFIYIMYTLFNLLKVKRIKINITKQELTMIVALMVYMLFTLVIGLYMGIENKSIYK
ncbi:hypothetical protein COJ97_26020, partial [Bacillus cereus]